MKEVRNQKLVYFATPYTSKNPVVVAQRFVDIHKIVEDVLLKFPMLIPFSPIVYTHQFGHLPMDWLKRMDYFMLDVSDVLIVVEMTGWQESEGVNKEIAFAKANDIPIHYASPADVISVCYDIEKQALLDSQQPEAVLNAKRNSQKTQERMEKPDAESDVNLTFEERLSKIKEQLAKMDYLTGVHSRQIVELQRDHQAEITFLQTDVQSLKDWREQQKDE